MTFGFSVSRGGIVCAKIFLDGIALEGSSLALDATWRLVGAAGFAGVDECRATLPASLGELTPLPRVSGFNLLTVLRACSTCWSTTFCSRERAFTRSKFGEGNSLDGNSLDLVPVRLLGAAGFVGMGEC